MKIPESIIERERPDFSKVTIYGIPLCKLTHDELMAALCILNKASGNTKVEKLRNEIRIIEKEARNRELDLVLSIVNHE